MLDHVPRDFTALSALQNQKSAHQGHSATRQNCLQLSSVRTALLENTVRPTTWSSRQGPVERGTIVPQGHPARTRLSAPLEDTALRELMSLNCVQMEHIGTSQRGYLSVTALTVHLDIIARVWD